MSTADRPRTDPADEDLRLRVVCEQARARVPSVVAGVARAGERLGVAAVGLADVERGVVADAARAYRIGSVTKVFTAALVLGLVEEGRLTLDAPVDHYLSGTALVDVPLGSLLSHSGGVQREVPGDMWESMRGPDGRELRQALAGAELVARPGERWHYSNLGYAVLGQIVERVVGVGCAELIDQRLVKPLGLSATVWARPEGAAVGYRTDPYADLVHREPDMDQGAVGVGGQLWSTVEDLLVLGDALAGGAPDLVSPRVVEAMHTLQVMVDPASWASGWGLGLMLERRGDRVISGHTGAMPGFQSAVWLDRDTRTVAVVVSNATRGAAVGTLAADLVHERRGGALAADPAAALTGWVPCGALPSELDGVLGRWWSEAEETVFSWRADGLHARLVSGPASSETRFERITGDVYRAVTGRFFGERLTVCRDSERAVVKLQWATYPFTREPR